MKSIFLTGASGTGKTTAYHSLMEGGFKPSPNYLTRLPRVDEIDGLDAYFVSEQEFAEKMRAGVMLEDSMTEAEYLGVYYGSPRAWLEAVEETAQPIVAIPANVTTLRGLCRALESRGVRSNALWANLHADRDVRHSRIYERVADAEVLEGRLSSGVGQGEQEDADVNIDTGVFSKESTVRTILSLASKNQ